MKYDIKNRWTGKVQFTADIECDGNASDGLKKGLAVKWAIANKANLGDANLRWADLRGANLRGANLRWADLRGADLSDANLRWADLRGADLRGANLRGANLRWADLRGADLSDANLRGANLRGANLRWADLRGADLRGADLRVANGVNDRIIDGGLRSDGYRFLLTRTEPGDWRIKAGCRNFTIPEATEHWTRTRPVGNALGDETRLIINHMIAVAKLRNWPETGESK